MSEDLRGFQFKFWCEVCRGGDGTLHEIIEPRKNRIGEFRGAKYKCLECGKVSEDNVILTLIGKEKSR